MRKNNAVEDATQAPEAPARSPRARRPLPSLAAARRRLRAYQSILDEPEAFAPSADDPYPDNHGPSEPRRHR